MTLAPIEHALPAPTTDGLARLREWAAAASDAAALVGPLVDTPFVPDSYRPKVDPRATVEEKAAARQVAVASATAAVLQGIGIGLDPLVSLQQIYVVHGRPGMYARIKVALVLAAGHEIWTEDLSDARAVVAGRRRGGEAIERVTITMDQARKAGWTKNDTYNKTPADMLWARAAGRVCDRIAPDTLMGIAAVEEVEDEHAASSAPATRTVQRSTARAALAAPPAPAQSTTPAPARQAASATPAPAPAPSGPPLPGEDDEPVAPLAPAAAQGIDERQWRAINARFADLGVQGTGQDRARMQVIRRVVGRPDLQKGSELLAIEAALVLDNLAGDPGREMVRSILVEDGAPEHLIPASTEVVEQVADEAGEPDIVDEDPEAGIDPTVEGGFTGEAAPDGDPGEGRW